MIAQERPARISARNVLEGRIADVWEAGNLVLVRVDVGVPVVVEVTRDARESLALEEGRRVHLLLKSSAVAVLE